MPDITAINPYSLAAGAAALLLLIGLFFWWLRARRSLPRRLKQASIDRLANILVPDGDGGEIHIQHALLTARGVVIIDIKEVSGNVFGSDSMQDWTVISEKRRFTFSNPQPALYDRLAAVRRLIAEIPVTGFIAFTQNAEFTKGRPTNVIPLDELLDELQAEIKDSTASTDPFFAEWTKLRDEAVTTQVGQLLKD
jgi:hypothetical protein